MILILIRCCLRMLPKVILSLKHLTWIPYLILQIPILFLLCCHSRELSLFFFFPNLTSSPVSNLVFNPHYMTQKYLCWHLACYIFDGRVSEILSGNNNPHKMIVFKNNKGEKTKIIHLRDVELCLIYFTWTILEKKGSFQK